MKKEATRVELLEILFRITRYMKGEMSFKEGLTHLSILQIQALIFLSQHKNVAMGDIAEHFDIGLPSATSLLNKLCDQKLVERHTDEEDRRLVRLTLTGGGKELLKQAMCQRRKKLERILSYLSEKEQNDLLTIVKTLANRLQK